MEAVSKNVLKIKIITPKLWQLNLDLKSFSEDACLAGLMVKLFHN